MRVAVALTFACLVPCARAEPDVDAILRRVAEEAAVFARTVPQVIGQETLHQSVVARPSRFRLRIGQDATRPPEIHHQERDLVSEYGFTTFPENPGSIHELRKVVSVDGRQVTSPDKARETLSLGVTGKDARLRNKLVRQFEQYGLKGGATDFGPMLLLFTGRHLGDFEFTFLREDSLGAVPALVLRYHQRQGDDAVMVFEGKRAMKAPLEGELWVRASDSLPLRVTSSTVLPSDKHVTEHRGSVDYAESRYGVVLPSRVHYQKLVDSQVVVDNVAEYSQYQMFSSSVEIEFQPAPKAP